MKRILSFLPILMLLFMSGNALAQESGFKVEQYEQYYDYHWFKDGGSIKFDDMKKGTDGSSAWYLDDDGAEFAFTDTPWVTYRKENDNWASQYHGIKLTFEAEPFTSVTYHVRTRLWLGARSTGPACAMAELYDFRNTPMHPEKLYSAEYAGIIPNEIRYNDYVVRKIAKQSNGRGNTDNKRSEYYNLDETVDNRDGGYISGPDACNKYGYRYMALHCNENSAYHCKSNRTTAQVEGTVVSREVTYYRYIRYYYDLFKCYKEQNETGTFNLLKNTITRVGHRFAGWTTNYFIPPVEYGDEQQITVTPDNYGLLDLYAVWEPNQYTITFKNQDENGNYVDVGTKEVTYNDFYPTLELSPYGGSRQGAYFMGYYTEPNGKGTRVYDTQLTRQINRYQFDENITLYAHYIPSQFSVYWDYSYQNGATYANLSEHDANRIQYARMSFLDKDGNTRKSVILQPQSVANKSGVTSDFDTHTTTHASIQLNYGTGTDVLTGDEMQIYFSTWEFNAINTYTLEPMLSATDVATGWATTYRTDLNATVFSFAGAEDDSEMYTQKWELILRGIQPVFPEVLYVKPVFGNNSNQWEEITQLTNTTGVQCLKGTVRQIYTNKPEAQYNGEFPVWKKYGSDYYLYAIALVGFTLDGETYYINKDNPGAIDTHYVSYSTNTGANPTKTISYTLDPSQLPILTFNLDGGILANGLTDRLVTGYNETIENLMDTYYASKPGYILAGWQYNDGNQDVLIGWGGNITVDKAYTLTAKWEPVPFDVLIPGKDAPVTAYYGEEMPTLSASDLPTRAGYSLEGLYYDVYDSETDNMVPVKYYNADGTSAHTFDIVHDIMPSLYARWTAETYTVSFDLNGKPGDAPTAITTTYGAELPNVEVPEAAFGYTFMGFYDSTDADATMYYNAEGQNMYPWDKTESATLYARWTSSFSVPTHMAPQTSDTYYTTFFDGTTAYEVFNSDATIYTAEYNSAGECFIMHAMEGNVIPVNTAVILQSGEASIALSPADEDLDISTVVVPANSLQGVDETTDVATLGAGNYYTLAAKNGVMGFYHYSGATLGAHKAYFYLPEGASAPRCISFDSQVATGIVNTEAASQVEKVMSEGQIFILKNNHVYTVGGVLVK